MNLEPCGSAIVREVEQSVHRFVIRRVEDSFGLDRRDDPYALQFCSSPAIVNRSINNPEESTQALVRSGATRSTLYSVPVKASGIDTTPALQMHSDPVIETHYTAAHFPTGTGTHYPLSHWDQ